MNWLKKLPLTFIGKLNHVKLVNFSVEMDEVIKRVPKPIQIRDFEGRALISMVDVQLTGMHPTFLPKAFSFQYRHIAFRLLVDDGHLNEGVPKGIHFLQSFTDKPLMVTGGKWLTPYHLSTAKLFPNTQGIRFEQGEKFLEYGLAEGKSQPSGSWYEAVRKIDRAYSTLGDEVFKTQICREEWPLAEREIAHFQTNFFATARPEAAFEVIKPIDYKWLPLEKVAWPKPATPEYA